MTKAPAPSTDSPAAPTSLLEGYLRDSYGLAVHSMKFLGGELDRNYRVRTPEKTYLAKFQLHTADRDEQQWQEDILLYLADRNLDVPVPTLVRTTTGRTSLAIVTEDAEQGTLRVFDWVFGTELAKVADHSDVLLRQLGATAARITQALEGFTAPDLQSTHHWDVTNSRAAIEVCIAEDESLGDLPYVRTVLVWFDAVAPHLADLPAALVHHDLNDNNVLVTLDGASQQVSGVLDFNDALYTVRVSELAVAGAYAMLRKLDPLAALGRVVAGYNDVTLLTDDEIEVIFPLAAARLCVQVLTWTTRGRVDPTAYGQMRMQYTLPALLAVTRLEPAVASAYLRSMCRRDASPTTERARQELRNASSAAVFSRSREPRFVDAVAGLAPLTVDPEVTITASKHLSVHARRSDLWRPDVGEPETVSLGTALWTVSREILYAPLPGSVHRVDPLILEHTDASGSAVAYSVWSNVLPLLEEGDRVTAGMPIGETLAAPAPGDPTLRVQVVATADLAQRLPAYVSATDAQYWAAVTIDAGVWFGSTLRSFVKSTDSRLSLVRGDGVWLYDSRGVRYLDGRSEGGVHVGHSDPRTVLAAHRQMRSLDAIDAPSEPSVALAQRLLATVSQDLDTVLFVDSSGDAMRLADHLARRATGRTTVIRLDKTARTAVEQSDAAAVIVQALIPDGVHPLESEAVRLSCDRVQATGGLVIADETGGGPGRSGEHTWRFETLRVTPDIVVVGRAVANGQPIAAVLTRTAITHDAGVDPAEYNANPVSAAVGLAVLDIVERDGLLTRAGTVGRYLDTGLQQLQERSAAVVEVRGSGLTMGLELATESGSPATVYARTVHRRLAQRSVLIGRTGTHENVLTIDPPMIFSHADVDLLVHRLADVLTMADISPADADSIS